MKALPPLFLVALIPALPCRAQENPELPLRAQDRPGTSVPGTGQSARHGSAGVKEQIGENVTEARAILARPTPRGGLSLPGLDIDIAAYVPGWTGIPIKSDWSKSGESSAKSFEIRGRDDGLLRFRGSGQWTQREDGSLAGHIELECVAEEQVQCLALSVSHPEPPRWGLGDGKRAAFDFSLEDGRAVQLTAAAPLPYHSQDSHQWGGQFSTRIGGHIGTGTGGGIRAFKPGERLVWDISLSSPDGIAFSDYKPLTITENENWVRLDYKKDVVPGSALDFSGMGFQDAPAGRHGWLKAVGGHFEFEGLPGVEQRFYGVNLCFSANYPDHDMADRLVERFVRCGYNSIRVHHHDGMWAEAYASRSAGGSGAEPPSFADDIDKLDYLLARCYEAGLYVTTDLYVSRPVAWRDIGIDRDGNMEKQLYKTYVGLHDGAFSNWCHWAQAFLEHVNPYTGRANKDEPGMPLISLVNEGKLHMAWARAGKAKDPVVRAAWAQFCEEQAAAARGSGAVPPSFSPEPPPPGAADYADPHHQFDEWVNRKVWERGSAFVRSLGCRALLTNDNNGRWHGEGEGLTPLYDYVDSHFYVDHPAFLDQQWKLPSRCTQQNPVRADTPAIFHREWSSAEFSKPCTITEWNFSGPGRYRAMGGILTGAMAAEQCWDGLWRFAYSHSNGNLLDGQGHPGYFDCVTDPLIAASDRASVALFLDTSVPSTEQIGTSVPGTEQIGTSVPSTEQAAPGAELAAPGAEQAAPSTEQAAPGAEQAAPGAELAAPGVELAAPGAEQAAPGHQSFANQSLRLDRERGTMVLDTPRTSGGFAESGRLDCGVLSFEIAGDPAIPATIWASSLDGKPLAQSSRILLTHLTDVQGDGALYSDETRRILLKWGKKPLVEVGSAEVELRLAAHAEAKPETAAPEGAEAKPETAVHAAPIHPAVWALDTAGNRVSAIPAAYDPATGILRFTVSTRDTEGHGRIHYEIAR